METTTKKRGAVTLTQEPDASDQHGNFGASTFKRRRFTIRHFTAKRMGVGVSFFVFTYCTSKGILQDVEHAPLQLLQLALRSRRAALVRFEFGFGIRLWYFVQHGVIQPVSLHHI